jgi:HAAS domain-containing protein
VSTHPAVEAYLRAVAAGLPGPRQARDDILAELRSGLLDAIDARRCAGLAAQAATEAALTEFGDPGQVAGAFRPHLAMTQARRTALALAATGPPIGLLWVAAAFASHIAIRQAPPWGWPGAPPLAHAAFLVTAAAILLLVASTLATVAVTGKLTRWLPASPHTAAVAAATAGIGAAAVDLAILGMLVSKLVSAPGTLAPLPVAAATAASLTRLTLARLAARRCLATRAALI